VFAGERLKRILFEQTVSLGIYRLIIGGLPNSGKTTLVNSMFDLARHEKTPGDAIFDVHLHEGVIYRSKLSGEHKCFEMSQLQANSHIIVPALARVFANEYQLPLLDTKDLNQFKDAEIQRYFETMCKSLIGMVASKSATEKMLSGSDLSFFNVFDIGVNRAVHEFMMAVSRNKKNLLFINVLDLTEPNREVSTEPLNLESPRYERQYSGNEAGLFKNHSALHHFVSLTRAASLANNTSTLIVGTHKDQFQPTSKCNERVMELKTLLKKYDIEMGHNSNVSSPDVVAVDTTDKDDCKLVMDHLLKLVDGNKGFSDNIPVKYIFLRYVLFSTKKVLMSRQEVIEYAKKCELNDFEVESFLEIFRNCASIISSPLVSEFLHEFIILLPIDFLRGLNRLYCIQDEHTIPAELREPAQFGVVSESALRVIWQGSNEFMPTWEFYVNVLKNVLLLMEYSSGKYFCPSVRLKHDENPVRPESLIISSSVAFTSFSGMQCAFVKHLVGNHRELRLDEECPYYNAVEFTSKSGTEEGRISIRFFHHFIEVFVDPSSISSIHAATLYSILKTDCVAIMNEFSHIMQYKLSVTCPHSNMEPTDCHFIRFNILESCNQTLQCTMCKKEVFSTKGIHWLKAAYQGSRKAALIADGKCAGIYITVMSSLLVYKFFE
jgi:GTPase SAR1 family protein